MPKINVRILFEVSYPTTPQKRRKKLQARIQEQHETNMMHLLAIPTRTDGISKVQIHPVRHQDDGAGFKIQLDVTADSWEEANTIARDAIAESLGSTGKPEWEIVELEITPR